MIGRYKTKNEFVSPMMDSMLNRENVTYNFRNLQEFQLERKRNMFLYSRNFKLPCNPTMDTFVRKK